VSLLAISVIAELPKAPISAAAELTIATVIVSDSEKKRPFDKSGLFIVILIHIAKW
jgi:hypothetical protein